MAEPPLIPDERILIPRIPGLRLGRRLGRGGMGAVFAARTHGHTVALKLVASDRLPDEATRTRFQREIEALREIRHRNVLRLLDAGEIDRIPYAMFERVRGRTLGGAGPLPWPVVVDLGQQLARATAAVHAAGWLHRDIKPGNLMVGRHGLLTLIDFGLAKRQDAAEVEEDSGVLAIPPSPEPVTVHGTVVGTRRYLAPEMLRGEPATPAVDVYAFGITLTELLGGGVAPDGAVVPPPRVPSRLERLIERAYHPDPEARPTAAELADELERMPAERASVVRLTRDSELTWSSGADRLPTANEAPAP